MFKSLSWIALGPRPTCSVMLELELRLYFKRAVCFRDEGFTVESTRTPFSSPHGLQVLPQIVVVSRVQKIWFNRTRASLSARGSSPWACSPTLVTHTPRCLGTWFLPHATWAPGPKVAGGGAASQLTSSASTFLCSPVLTPPPICLPPSLLQELSLPRTLLLVTLRSVLLNLLAASDTRTVFSTL